MSVCKQMDDWLSDRAELQAIWIADLTNGETIFQDDNRPGEEEWMAWRRHRCHCGIARYPR